MDKKIPKKKFMQLKLDFINNNITLPEKGKDEGFDAKFNDKNIFTKKYEKPLLMSKEDIEKFIKLKDETKIEVMESLLDTVENNKNMESLMDKMLKDMDEVKQKMLDFNNSRVVVDKNKEWDIDDELGIELYTVTSNLKDVLNDKKMSQTELCERTGINKSTLSNIINSPEKITLLNAYRISKILKRPIEEIFDFDIDMNEYV